MTKFGNLLGDLGKILTTLALFAKSITIGCVSSFFPFVLEELRQKLGTDEEQISKMFKIFATLSMVGSLSGILLFKKIRRQLGTMYILVGISVSMMMIPNCPGLESFLVAIGVLGFLVGLIVPGQIVWTMEMWQKRSTPILQALMFFFSIGASLPPFITAPFLMADPARSLSGELSGTTADSLGLDEQNGFDDGTSFQLDNGTSSSTETRSMEMSDDYRNESIVQFYRDVRESSNPPAELSNIHIPFAIVGVMAFFNAWIERILFKRYTYKPPPPAGAQQKSKPDELNKSVRPSSQNGVLVGKTQNGQPPRDQLDDRKEDSEDLMEMDSKLLLKPQKIVAIFQKVQVESLLDKDTTGGSVGRRKSAPNAGAGGNRRKIVRRNTCNLNASGDSGSLIPSVSSADPRAPVRSKGVDKQSSSHPEVINPATRTLDRTSSIYSSRNSDSADEGLTESRRKLIRRNTGIPSAVLTKGQRNAGCRASSGSLGRDNPIYVLNSAAKISPTNSVGRNQESTSSSVQGPLISTISPVEEAPGVSGIILDTVAELAGEIPKRPTRRKSARVSDFFKEGRGPPVSKDCAGSPVSIDCLSRPAENKNIAGSSSSTMHEPSNKANKDMKKSQKKGKKGKRKNYKKEKEDKEVDKEVPDEDEEVPNEDEKVPEEDKDISEEIVDSDTYFSEESDTDSCDRPLLSSKDKTSIVSTESDIDQDTNSKDLFDLDSEAEDPSARTPSTGSLDDIDDGQRSRSSELDSEDGSDFPEESEAEVKPLFARRSDSNETVKKGSEREVLEEEAQKSEEKDSASLKAHPPKDPTKSKEVEDNKITVEPEGDKTEGDGNNDDEGEGNPVQKILKQIKKLKKVFVGVWKMLKNADSRKTLYVIGISSVFFGAYAALEKFSKDLVPQLGMGGNLKLTEEEGSLLLQTFVLSFIGGRLGGMVISLKITPFALLCSNLACIFLGNFVLIFGASFSLHVMLGGVVLLGVGLSTVYAGLFTFLSGQIPFTDAVGSILIVLSTITTYIYGDFVEGFISRNPQRLTSANYISGLTCTLAFKIVYSITKRKRRDGPVHQQLEQVVAQR